MEHYTNTLYDTFGNAISGASVTVYAAGTTTESTLYTDNGITPGDNPLTTGADGSYDFYAANGRYDLLLTHPSFTFSSGDTAGIALFDPNDGPVAYTPVLTCNSTGDLAITYSVQSGLYQVTGKKISAAIRISTSTMTHTTATGRLMVSLPVTASDSGLYITGSLLLQGDNVTGARGFAPVIGYAALGYMSLNYMADSGGVITDVNVTDHSSGGNNLIIFATITYWKD